MKSPDLPQRTDSIWTEPGVNFYRFLKRLEFNNLPKTLAVLGCADGTYVVPAARRGFKVTAIDMDPVALYGGVVSAGEGTIDVPGLMERLRREQLQDMVTVLQSNFIEDITRQRYSGVFTSGSVHYRENSAYPIEMIMQSIQSYVARNGFLYFEYIHADENRRPPRHYLTLSQVNGFFCPGEWEVTSHKRKKYEEGPNPRNPKVHDITWGRLYARRIQEPVV